MTKFNFYIKIALIVSGALFLASCETFTGKGNLKGTLTYADGEALQTRLCVTSQENQRLCLTTDANGNFSFQNIPALRYSLAIENYGSLLYYKTNAFMNVGAPDYFAVPKNSTKNLTLTVANGKKIGGNIFNSAKAPVDNSINYKVALFDKTKKRIVADTVSKNGAFMFKNAPIGDYFLILPHYRQNVYFVTNSESTLNAGDAKAVNLIADRTNLKMFLPSGQDFNLKIKDFNNNLISQNFKVYLFKKNASNKASLIFTHNYFREFKHFFSAEVGKLTLKDALKGEYKICIAKYNFGVYCYKKPDTTANKVKDGDFFEVKNAAVNLEVKLPKGKNLSGALVYADNSPVTFPHKIEIYDATTNKKLMNLDEKPMFAYSDAQGKFSFINIPDGDYKISVRDYLTEKFYKTDASATQVLNDATSINVNANDASPINKKLRINKGYKVKGKFYLHNKPLANKNIFIGQIKEQGKVSAMAAITDANGEFEFSDIPTGEHLLFIRHTNKVFFYRANANAIEKEAKATKISINNADLSSIEFKFTF